MKNTEKTLNIPDTFFSVCFFISLRDRGALKRFLGSVRSSENKTEK